MARRRTSTIEALEARQMLALFANGIDSENMGKGAWGWDLRNAMIQQGFTYSSANYGAFFSFLKSSMGLDYFITKAADADDVFNNGGGVQNYTVEVKNAAQAAGIKMLPYFYIYGGAKANSTLQGEINVFKQFMDPTLSGGGANPNYVGGDGAVLDIEGEYAGATGGAASAIVTYATGIGKSQAGSGAGIRDNFFISYSSFPYVHNHLEVPWVQLGDYFDATMPQAYWATIAFSPSNSPSRSPTKGQALTGVGGPTRMITDIHSEYGQRSLESTPRNNVWFGLPNSIKPLILTGQSYGTATASEITEFITAAKNSTTMPKTGASGAVYSHGYRSIDFFDLNSTDAAERTAINGQTVGATPATPSSPTPAHNATSVSPTNLVLDWADIVDATTTGAATSYDVYFDGVLRANVTSSSWTITPAIFGGSHTWQIVAKNVRGNNSGPVWNFTATVLMPGTPSNPSPVNNAVLNSIPSPFKLDWDDTPNTSSYEVFLGTNATPFTTSISELTVTPGDGVRLWRVKAINSDGFTNGPQWQYTLDRIAPGASFGNQTPANGSATLDFTVNYTDATTGVDISSLDNSDITVSGPNGYSAAATLVSVDTLSNGSPRLATYRIAAPGGTWNPADNGSYTVSQVATQVKDVAANYRTAGTVGSFSVNFADFAFMSGTTLTVTMDGASPIQLGPSGSDVLAIKGTTTLSFSGVTDITVNGTPSSDTLDYGGTIAAPITYNGGSGGDRLNVMGGTYTFGSDAGATTTGLDVYVSSGGTVNFNSVQNLAHLNVAAGGSATSSVGVMSLSDGLDNAGTIAINAGAAIGGTGTILNNTGSLSVGAGSNVMLGGQFASTGTLAVEGAVSVAGGGSIGGVHTWGVGAVFNAGSALTTFTTNAGGNLTINASVGGVQFNSSQTLGALNLSGTGTASMAADGNRFLHVNGLTITGDAGLNLNDNDLIVEYGTNPSAYADVRALVLGGFGGTTGINSGTSDGSQILALFDNGLIGATEWLGEAIGANSVIGKYTYFGDANIDGQVTGDDYTVIDANLNTTPAPGLEWLSGDMNLDDAVTGDDYTVIDANLGLGNGNPLSPASFSNKKIQSQPDEEQSLVQELGL